MRLRHHGLPEFGGQRHGDMYVRVQVRVPEDLSHEEREQYEQLRALRRGEARAFATPRTASPTKARHSTAQPTLKGWLAKGWHRIDTAVRQWLQGD